MTCVILAEQPMHNSNPWFLRMNFWTFKMWQHLLLDGWKENKEITVTLTVNPW